MSKILFKKDLSNISEKLLLLSKPKIATNINLIYIPLKKELFLKSLTRSSYFPIQDSNKIKKTVSLLNGKNSLLEIIHITKISKYQILNLLNWLIKNYAIQKPTFLSIPDHNITYKDYLRHKYFPRVNISDRKSNKLANKKIIIYGVNRISLKIIQLLIRSGAKNFLVFSSSKNYTNNSSYKSIIEQIADLKIANPDLSISFSRLSYNRMHFPTSHFDIVIGCLPHRNNFLYANINKICLNKNIPWIYSQINPLELSGMVGPLTNSFSNSCYNCLKLRLKENCLYTKENYLRRTKLLPPKKLIDYLENFTAQVLTLETIRTITGSEMPKLINHVLIFEGLHPVKYKELIKKESCASCNKPDSINKSKIRSSKSIKLRLIEKKATYFENGLRSVLPSKTIKKSNKLIGKIGVISDVSITPVNNSLKKYSSISADPYGDNRIRKHFGKGISAEQNIASTTLEAIERYCAKLLGDEKFVDGSYQQLKHNAIHPKNFILPENVDNVENTSIKWTWGYSLTNNRPVLVPAELVYILSKKHIIENKNIYINTSCNGLAAGNNLEEAILQAIFELIERDAMVIMELNELCMPDVNSETIKDNYCLQLLSRLESAKINYYIKYITNDIPIPSFGVFIKGKSENKPSYAFAAGTHFNKNIALSRAISEAIQGYPRFRETSLWLQKRHIKHLYQKSSLLNYFDILDYRNSSIKKNIEKCVQILNTLGMEVIVCNLTRSKIGFNVVRVLITNIQCNYLWVKNLKFRRFSKRLFQMPIVLHFSKNRTSPKDIISGPLCGHGDIQ